MAAHNQLQPSVCTGRPYPETVWQQLVSLAPPGATAVFVSAEVCGVPSAAAQMSAAGLQVVKALVLQERALSSELHSTSRTCRLAMEEAAEPAAAASAGEGQQPSAVDVLALADVLHLTDRRRALQAARQHLKERGLLAAVWTDRDLSFPFVLGLEELLEGAVPGYSRYSSQHDAAEWAPRLQMGGMFRLIDYSAFPHTLRLPLGAFLDDLTSRGALHAALGSSRRRAFHAAVRHLAEQHFGAGAAGAVEGSRLEQQEGPGRWGEQLAAGRHPQRQGSRHQQHAQAQGTAQLVVELPLLTKLYTLCKSTVPAAPVSIQRGGRAAGAGWHASPLEPGRACLFCGSPAEEE